MLESRRVKANKAECECFPLAVRLQKRGNECKVECINNENKIIAISFCAQFIRGITHYFLIISPNKECYAFPSFNFNEFHLVNVLVALFNVSINVALKYKNHRYTEKRLVEN